MTQSQMQDIKYYSQQLQESITIAFWATTDFDRKYHTSRANEYLDKIFSIRESV
tara:strand:- start:3280 stop:3441 length:162 start_codon:yes stop_codon:yes gene_type:complete